MNFQLPGAGDAQTTNFLQSILNGGSSLGQVPIFTKNRTGFKTKVRDGRRFLTHDPVTGEKIKKKDQKLFKRFKRNPFDITPGNSLNLNIPSILSGQNIPGIGGLPGGLAGILSQVNRIGGQ